MTYQTEINKQQKNKYFDSLPKGENICQKANPFPTEKNLILPV